MNTTGELRKFLSNIALGVAHGDIKADQAAVAVKACKEINASLYSEIKAATIQASMGRQIAQLGDLPLSNNQ